jgi:hypothetical protein
MPIQKNKVQGLHSLQKKGRGNPVFIWFAVEGSTDFSLLLFCVQAIRNGSSLPDQVR